MWRWSQQNKSQRHQGIVFSTYVEVILYQVKAANLRNGILHVCGGDPELAKTFFAFVPYSPRMWRWSYFPYFFRKSQSVFSTYVEVILNSK